MLPRDIRAFLAKYPGVPPSDPENDPSPNCLFYLNRLRCQPDDLLIEEIHSSWYGDYEELESNHVYIQWLFPIQEEGMNMDAYRLLPHEIEVMRSKEEIISRLIKSYEMMLDFYGMRLISESGLLGHSLPPRNYLSRYRNLLRELGFEMSPKCRVYVGRIGAPHNNLRITRMLKCLSELGLERFNAGFILHVLREQSENNELKSGVLQDSMDRWWANCIRDDHEREWVGRAIAKVRAGGSFTSQTYVAAVETRQATGRFPDDMDI